MVNIKNIESNTNLSPTSPVSSADYKLEQVKKLAKQEFAKLADIYQDKDYQPKDAGFLAISQGNSRYIFENLRYLLTKDPTKALQIIDAIQKVIDARIAMMEQTGSEFDRSLTKILRSLTVE